MGDILPVFHLDFTGTVALWAAGILGIDTWRRLGWPLGSGMYWMVAGLGLVYLGFDERLSLHERIGEGLDDVIVTPPGVNDLDDMVLVAYALAGVMLTLVCLGGVRRSGVVWVMLVAACMLTATAISSDALGPKKGWVPFAEERVEWAGQLLFLGAFGWRWSEVRAGAGEASPRRAWMAEGVEEPGPGGLEGRPAG